MTHWDLELPEGYDASVALLIGAWQDSTREWLGEMGEVTDAAITWKFAADSVTIGALMMHMIACEEWHILGSLFGEKPDSDAVKFDAMLDVDERIFPEPPAWPFSKYLELLHSTRARLLERLRDLPGDTVRTTPRGNTVTVRWVLSHLVQHDSYHGGQIVLIHEEHKKSQTK